MRRFARSEDVAGETSEGLRTTAFPAEIAPITGSIDSTEDGNTQLYKNLPKKSVKSCMSTCFDGVTCLRKIGSFDFSFIHIQKGKFQVEITNTTPSGSETISADDGYVVIEVFT